MDPKNPGWEDRDRFVLSKGHCVEGLLCILADKGFFDKAILQKMCIRDRNNGYEAAKQVFFMEERPTAIVASNDLQAIGFWKACKDYRIKVPQEIELCGMDNLDTCDIIQMSSIRMWEDAVGKAGAEMVLDRLEGAESEQHRDVVFRPTLILRDGNK